MERDLDGIAMSDIAERAEVNRATVYLHYKDREDLLLDATESTMEGIVDAASACRLLADTHTLSDAPPVHLVNLFTLVDRHRAIYRRMLGENGSSRFASRLEQLLAQAWFEQLLTEAVPGSLDETALLLRAHFLSGALVSVISQWTGGRLDRTENEEHDAVSIERIAQATWSLIRRGA